MSREFWINQSRCTAIPVAYLSQESALEHVQLNDNIFKVREVNPAYDAAVEKLVEALTYAECHCKYKVEPSGNERTHECKRCAAFAAWERVNEGNP